MSMAAEAAGALWHVYGKMHPSIDNRDTDDLNDDSCQLCISGCGYLTAPQ